MAVVMVVMVAAVLLLAMSGRARLRLKVVVMVMVVGAVAQSGARLRWRRAEDGQVGGLVHFRFLVIEVLVAY